LGIGSRKADVMNSFLRNVSTRRLLAMIAGLVAAIAAGTAIAVAAAGSGPVPRAKPLARAIHDALAAPAVQGITARISFTNHLIDSSDIQGSDPILTGATGRLWLARDHRVRLELQGDNGDAQVLVNGRTFWLYDPSSNTVYEGALPDKHLAVRHRAERESIPTVAEIQTDLNRLMAHVDVSRAIPSDVADQPTYTVRVSPKHDGGLLGAAELAWDAVRGVPLRIAVYARGNGSPVLELKASDISYGPVSSGVFAISPPRGAKVVRVAVPSGTGSTAAHRLRAGHRPRLQISGLAAVARHLSFGLVAPRSLVGLPRRSVTLLDWKGTPAAVVSYGQNLGGIAVIEQTVQSTKQLPQPTGGEGHRGLSLPTVSINGITGQELDTALGTMVRFTRGAVSYTVLGSVPAAAADAAARAL
jgi:outer membrane lipoprotein-sorting protein